MSVIAPCDDPRCPCEAGDPCSFGSVSPPQILDACCGGRMWWWDKNHPLAVYMDKRSEPPGSSPRRPNWSCQPSLLADFKEMPFDDDSFQLVLFDPPHLVRDKSSFSELRLRYGELTTVNEQEELGLGFAECWRVLAPGGTLVFKWAGSIERAEQHFPCDPVVGTRGAARGSLLGTRWFIFYKPLEADAEEPVLAATEGGAS